MKTLLFALAAAGLAVPGAQAAADRVVSPDDRSQARTATAGLLPQSADAEAPPRAAHLIHGEGVTYNCYDYFCIRPGISPSYISLDATTAGGGSGVAVYVGVMYQTSLTIALDCVAVQEHSFFRYIETFYNPRRRHSSLDGISPDEYERRFQNRLQGKETDTIETTRAA